MPSAHSITQTLTYFKDRRLLSIFCFGIASGFPWVMIGSAMSGWLKDEGLSRSSIGLFGLIFVAYSINFLWSPLVDRIKIPLLTLKMGQRRSWIIFSQLIILLSALQLSQLDATHQLNLMALFGLVIAISGATQDIAIDAYRIDSLTDKDSNYMAAGSAMATAGWWTGYAGLGSIPFILVDQPNWSWPQVYFVLALVMAVLMLTAIIVNEPKSQREQEQKLIENNYLKALPNHGYKPLAILLILPLIIPVSYTHLTLPTINSV